MHSRAIAVSLATQSRPQPERRTTPQWYADPPLNSVACISSRSRGWSDTTIRGRSWQPVNESVVKPRCGSAAGYFADLEIGEVGSLSSQPSISSRSLRPRTSASQSSASLALPSLAVDCHTISCCQLGKVLSFDDNEEANGIMTDNHSFDLPPAPPKWRSLLPAWLRGLIWTDQASSFDAFLSYSWKTDSEIAPILQESLQKFLCPWYRIRALNIFRDLSALAASEDLEKSLKEKLDRSHHLIVLASPRAKTSTGMEFEAHYWYSKPRSGQTIVVVTDGDYPDWESIRADALPPTLCEKMKWTPLWIDISRWRSRIAITSHAALVKSLHEELRQLVLLFYPGKSWSELLGEERTQRRKALRLVWTAVLSLSLITAVAVAMAYRAQH